MLPLVFVMLAITVTHIYCNYASTCIMADGQQPGLCMPVKSCRTVYELLLNLSESGGTLSDRDKVNLNQLYCGRFKNVVHVCCAESEIQLNVDGLNVLKGNTCGVYTENRIANGQAAALFGFPWMALLKYDDKIDPFKCGGTLITDQYVLTAAHCIQGKEHLIKAVRLGEYQISTQLDCTNVMRKNQCAPPVEDFEIAEFLLHEEYRNIYNDIALIRLNRKVEFKRHIKPICLPIYDYLRAKEPDDYVITGWGKTENGTSSDVLMAAFVPKVDRQDCGSQLRKYNLHHPLNQGHVCAGGRNLVDSCRGDSGGPLGYRDIYDGRPRFIQFGIVSIGLYKCGVINAPGIYTNVSHYMQWITDNLRETSYTFAQRSNQVRLTHLAAVKLNTQYIESNLSGI